MVTNRKEAKTRRAYDEEQKLTFNVYNNIYYYRSFVCAAEIDVDNGTSDIIEEGKRITRTSGK